MKQPSCEVSSRYLACGQFTKLTHVLLLLLLMYKHNTRPIQTSMVAHPNFNVAGFRCLRAARGRPSHISLFTEIIIWPIALHPPTYPPSFPDTVNMTWKGWHTLTRYDTGTTDSVPQKRGQGQFMASVLRCRLVGNSLLRRRWGYLPLSENSEYPFRFVTRALWGKREGGMSRIVHQKHIRQINQGREQVLKKS